MFKFLKEKLGKVLGRFSKEVEKESEKVEAPREEIRKPVEEKKAPVVLPKKVPEKKEIIIKSIIKEEPIKHEEPEEKKSFFTKVGETFTKFQLSDGKFEEIFWDLEVA